MCPAPTPAPLQLLPGSCALALALGCPGKGPLLSATSLRASSGPPTRQASRPSSRGQRGARRARRVHTLRSVFRGFPLGHSLVIHSFLY